jgi:glycosyltransferase involved in cell wall biosynthesis
MPPPSLTILHVVFSLEPGGMENGLVNVARRLDSAAFNVHVACLERKGLFAARLPDPSRVCLIGKSPGFSSSGVLKLARLIHQVKPDVIHTHNLGPLIYAALATGLGRWRPILHGEHGQLTGDHLSARRLRQRRWFFRCCRRIHTVSEGLRQDLLANGLADTRIEVVGNGVDTDFFQPASRKSAREQLGLAADGPVVGIVGRLCPYKRQAELIDLFPAVVRQFPNAQLLVVGGGGPDAERVEKLAGHSAVRQHIHLSGFQNDLRPYYQAMDLLAAPSLYEGLSNVVLEAMACGVPVLSHQACGNAEVVRHGKAGWVVDLREPAQLLEAVTAMLSDPARLIDMGRQAREDVMHSFSISTMVQHYERLYRELADRWA